MIPPLHSLVKYDQPVLVRIRESHIREEPPCVILSMRVFPGEGGVLLALNLSRLSPWGGREIAALRPPRSFFLTRSSNATAGQHNQGQEQVQER